MIISNVWQLILTVNLERKELTAVRRSSIKSFDIQCISAVAEIKVSEQQNGFADLVWIGCFLLDCCLISIVNTKFKLYLAFVDYTKAVQINVMENSTNGQNTSVPTLGFCKVYIIILVKVLLGCRSSGRTRDTTRESAKVVLCRRCF